MDGKDPNSSAAAMLEQWRTAERSVAVAHRGRVAAETALAAAREAADAAIATATAAKAALDSSALAETSAAKTAASARLMVQSATANLADAQAGSGLADVEEVAARDSFHRAEVRAKQE